MVHPSLLFAVPPPWSAAVVLAPAAPLVQGELLLELWAELEAIMQRRVDLLTPDFLQNPFLRAEVERTKYLLYDAARIEISVVPLSW